MIVFGGLLAVVLVGIAIFCIRRRGMGSGGGAANGSGAWLNKTPAGAEMMPQTPRQPQLATNVIDDGYSSKEAAKAQAAALIAAREAADRAAAEAAARARTAPRQGSMADDIAKITGGYPGAKSGGGMGGAGLRANPRSRGRTDFPRGAPRARRRFAPWRLRSRAGSRSGEVP